MLDSALRRQEKIRNLHKQFYYLNEKLQKVEMEYHAENDTLARLKLE
ncbi:MAG TPA: hypothetical protein VFV38_00365 [Ktedonobacteraceae bacterium]|nr:hypothetical protein [Ktedonobacteraceae bacterium]